MKGNINHKIVLFDGVCNLCNSSVIFIIKHDKEDRFRFSALQEAEGKRLISNYNIDTANVDSIILIDGDKPYVKSAAALRIAFYLSGAWPLLYAFMLFPAIIRNWVYDLVARNRYKWFGKKESCMIPTPELKEKFL